MKAPVNRNHISQQLLILGLLFLLASSTIGCASEAYARNVNNTHWHDDDTIVFVYTRDASAGGLNAFFNLSPLTTHVLICKIDEENAAQCREQRQLANILNPHAVDRVDLSDPWQP